MKSKWTKAVLVWCSILGALAVTFGYELVSNRSANYQLPRTGWSAGFHAYHAAGYDTVPVQVVSVISEIKRGLTAVRVKNHSDKNVSYVRLGWYVSDEANASEILAKGETPVLALPKNLASQETLKFDVPNIAWEKFLGPAMRKGTLRGDYSIQVVVSEITFDDSAIWRLPQPTDVTRVALKKNAHAPFACADQTCKMHNGVYRCDDSTGELCTNHGDSCDSSLCIQ